jgi:hypothetical protein
MENTNGITGIKGFQTKDKTGPPKDNIFRRTLPVPAGKWLTTLRKKEDVIAQGSLSNRLQKTYEFICF